METATVLSGREAKLCGYLERVAGRGSIPREVADSAWRAWGKIASAAPCIEVPDAGPGPDGSLLFAWDRGEHHLELEFYADQPPLFFYANRSTGDSWQESIGWVRNMAVECRQGGRLAWLCGQG